MLVVTLLNAWICTSHWLLARKKKKDEVEAMRETRNLFDEIFGDMMQALYASKGDSEKLKSKLKKISVDLSVDKGFHSMMILELNTSIVHFCALNRCSENPTISELLEKK